MTTKGVRRPLGLAPTAVLLLGALYCLLPVCWVLAASTKTRGELFTTNAFAPGTGLFSNIADLSAYRDGIFWQWMAKTALYAGVGALLSSAVSVLAGYALATGSRCALAAAAAAMRSSPAIGSTSREACRSRKNAGTPTASTEPTTANPTAPSSRLRDRTSRAGYHSALVPATRVRGSCRAG